MRGDLLDFSTSQLNRHAKYCTRGYAGGPQAVVRGLILTNRGEPAAVVQQCGETVRMIQISRKKVADNPALCTGTYI